MSWQHKDANIQDKAKRDGKNQFGKNDSRFRMINQGI